MIRKYEPFLEARLGFPIREADVTPLPGPPSREAAARYLVRRGQARYLFSIPAPAARDDGPAAARLAESLAAATALLAGTPIAATVPRIAVVGGGETPHAVVESARPGTPADGWIGAAWPFSQGRTRRLARLAEGWLASFQAATRRDARSLSATVRDLGIDRDAERLLDGTFPLDRESRDALARLARAAVADGRTVVPRCAAHGNFGPRSLVLARGEIVHVARWESFHADDHPLTDAWEFLLDAVPSGGARLGGGGHRLARHLLGGGWYRRLVDATIGRVCAAHGMETALARTFLALHLVRRAVRPSAGADDDDRDSSRLALLRHLLLFESEADGWIR